MGIEPTSEAWEASILPLYDARSTAFDSTQSCSVDATASFNKRLDVRRLDDLNLEGTRERIEL